MDFVFDRIIPRILIVFLAASASCSGPQKPRAQPPVGVRVDRILSKSESLLVAKALARLDVENPGERAATIVRVDYDLDTDGITAPIRGSSESGDVIEAGQRADLEFEIPIELPTSPEPYVATLEKGTIPVRLTAKVVFEDGRSVDVERASEIATPVLPKFIVHDAQAALYGGGSVEVALFLRLINENPFSVTVSGIDYRVFINETEMKTEQALGLTLVAGAAQEFEVGVVLDAKRFPGFAALMASKTIRYRVTGQVQMARLDLPFEHQGEIAIPEGGSE